jgi:hypothetical protein
MLRLQALAASLVSLTFAACAGGQDTYSNIDTRSLPSPNLRSVSYDEHPPDNCSSDTVALKVSIDRLKELQKKVTQEQQAPPPTLIAIWQGGPAAGNFAKERERAAQLNAALDAKGCKTIDIDEALRPAPGPATATGGNPG